MLSFEVNSTNKANLLLKIRFPQKAVLFQATKIPPDALTEGRNSKESKSTGQIFLMKSESKLS